MEVRTSASNQTFSNHFKSCTKKFKENWKKIQKIKVKTVLYGGGLCMDMWCLRWCHHKVWWSQNDSNRVQIEFKYLNLIWSLNSIWTRFKSFCDCRTLLWRHLEHHVSMHKPPPYKTVFTFYFLDFFSIFYEFFSARFEMIWNDLIGSSNQG